MQKVDISVDSEKCTECMCCQLICSLTYTGSFNPERAAIIIKPPDEIRFTEECRDGYIIGLYFKGGIKWNTMDMLAKSFVSI